MARRSLDLTQSNHRHPMWFLRSTATSEFLPRLRLCRLRGLDCHHDDLLLFLQLTKPQHITLQSVNRKSESWQRITEHITGPETGIKRVLLLRLTGPSLWGPMWFTEAPTQTFYSAEGDIGDSSLELRCDAVRRPIKYRFMAEADFESMKMRAKLTNHKRFCTSDPCRICLRHNL